MLTDGCIKILFRKSEARQDWRECGNLQELKTRQREGINLKK